MERRSASRKPVSLQLQNNHATPNVGASHSSPTKVKREFATPTPIHPGLASSVAQSLSSFDQLLTERRHRSALASLVERCPIFKEVPNTSVAPTLVQLAKDAPGVPLYIASSYYSSNVVKIPPALILKVADPALNGLFTFGTDKVKLAMASAIFKFLLWQCNAVSSLQDVSKFSYPLDWEDFVQAVHSSGHRLVNLPARALYPNGLPHSSPEFYPSEVLSDVIKQFAHPDPTRRLGVINRRHDNTVHPLMSKVLISVSNETPEVQPIEWSAVGRQTALSPPPSQALTLCRCNLCIDAFLGGEAALLGKQLVLPVNARDAGTLPLQWDLHWDATRDVFDLSHLPVQSRKPKLSATRSPSTALNRGPLFVMAGEAEWSVIRPDADEEAVAGVLSGDRFIPDFRSRNYEDDEENSSVYQLVTNDAIDDDMSITTSSCSTRDQADDDTPGDSTGDDPPDAMLDLPSIQEAEIAWDLEDFEVEQKRVLEDLEVKRKRDEEDRVREVERKRRRITLEMEYNLECVARQREEEDLRREEERRKQDEELKARLRERLDAIH